MPTIRKGLLTEQERAELWKETPCPDFFLDGKIYEFTEGEDFGPLMDLSHCKRIFIRACEVRGLVPIIQFTEKGFIFQAMTQEQRKSSVVFEDGWRLRKGTLCRAGSPNDIVDEECGQILLDHIAAREREKHRA